MLHALVRRSWFISTAPSLRQGIATRTMATAPKTHATTQLVSPAAEKHTKWVATVFNVEMPELIRDDDGNVAHAAVKLWDDNYVFISDKACPDMGWKSEAGHESAPPAVPQWMMTCVQVPNVDSTWAKAVGMGAVSARELKNETWGYRYGVLRDPWGFSWALSTPLPEVGADGAAKEDAGQK